MVHAIGALAGAEDLTGRGGAQGRDESGRAAASYGHGRAPVR